MKIKKIIPFLFAGFMLVITISIPYFMLAVQDHSLFNKTVIEDITDSQLDSKSLSIEKKLDIITKYLMQNSKYVYSIEGLSFSTQLSDEQKQMLYEEIKELYSLNGIIKIARSDLDYAYDCSVMTFRKDDILISLTHLYFVMSDKKIYVDLWFDSDTFKIYQYQINTEEKNKDLKKLDVEAAFMKYLDFDAKTFKTYYSLSVDSVCLYIYLRYK